MSDEIKEILRKWKCYIGLTKEFTTNEYEMLRVEDIEKLLDYITNLQEENERLKELCNKYEEEHSTAFKLWTMKMEEMPNYEEFMDYKSRCEKAVEYIKEHIRIDDEYPAYMEMLVEEKNELLNILGGDKE